MKRIMTFWVVVASAMAPIMADKVQPSLTLPDAGKPEHVYTMMNGNNVYG